MYVCMYVWNGIKLQSQVPGRLAACARKDMEKVNAGLNQETHAGRQLVFKEATGCSTRSYDLVNSPGPACHHFGIPLHLHGKSQIWGA